MASLIQYPLSVLCVLFDVNNEPCPKHIIGSVFAQTWYVLSEYNININTATETCLSLNDLQDAVKRGSRDKNEDFAQSSKCNPGV